MEGTTGDAPVHPFTSSHIFGSRRLRPLDDPEVRRLVPKGKVWVESEIGYVHPVDANGNGSTDDVSPGFSSVRPDGTGTVIPADYLGATQGHIIEGAVDALLEQPSAAGLFCFNA